MKRKIKNKLKAVLGPANFIDTPPGLEAYASDASIYKSYPIAVLGPRSYRQLRAATGLLIDNNIHFTSRGAGTGLAGGSVSDGVIIDFSRLNRVLRFDPEGHKVDVECGVVYEQLNRYLAPFGVFFPPDPSSGDTCQIGGMLGNNSSGARSVKYGTTRKYVEELQLILPDGSELTAHDYRLDSSEIEQLFINHPAFRNILDLIIQNRNEILATFPDLKKNVCGYDLKSVVRKLDQGIFSLPQLFVGSEGTLGLFVSAKLKLLPLPKSKLTSLILFDHLNSVADATIDFLTLSPSGLELIDGNTLDLIGRERFNLPSSAEAMLIVEFDNPPYEETIQKLKDYLTKYSLSCEPVFETDPSKQAALWRARKAIVPTLYGIDKSARPWGFIEDAAVPSDKMPGFIRFLNRIFKENNLTCGIFGHIGDGNLHVRPAINLSTIEGQNLARKIFDQVYDKIFSLGGSATAEHGDGHLRVEVIRKQYGEKIYQIFQQIKHELDPRGVANPEVIISTRKFTENIDVEKITRECAACGKCNSYCPSYEVYKSENMSARGWVRIMLSDNYAYKNAKAETDGCLNCKSCAIICPAGVDVSRYITQRRHENAKFWGKRIFSVIEKNQRFEKFALLGGRIFNTFSKKPLRPVLELLSSPIARVDKNRILPRFAKQTLRQRYAENTDPNRGEIAYFYGCADNLIDSKTGPSLINLLESHGHKVVLPEQKCCGVPQQTYGFFDHEKRHAIYNLESLDRFRFIVFSCATCLGQILSYTRLFEKGDRYYEIAKSVAAKSYDISEFILNNVDLKTRTNGASPMRIAFHQPCHLREAGRENDAERFIKALPSVNFVEMEDASFCCGSAGTYNIFHYENSMKIFERKKKAVRKISPDLILTNCPTCILQFMDGLKSRDIVCHSVELAARLCGFE